MSVSTLFNFSIIIFITTCFTTHVLCLFRSKKTPTELVKPKFLIAQSLNNSHRTLFGRHRVCCILYPLVQRTVHFAVIPVRETTDVVSRQPHPTRTNTLMAITVQTIRVLKQWSSSSGQRNLSVVYN